MKIVEHFLETKSGESKIILDLEPNTCIVYVTSHGIQIQEPFGAEALTFEQTGPIFTFIQSYLDTISEEEKPILIEQPILHEEQSRTHSENQTPNTGGEITQSIPQTDSKPNDQTEGRGEGEALGSEMVKDG